MRRVRVLGSKISHSSLHAFLDVYQVVSKGKLGIKDCNCVISDLQYLSQVSFHLSLLYLQKKKSAFSCQLTLQGHFYVYGFNIIMILHSVTS